MPRARGVPSHAMPPRVNPLVAAALAAAALALPSVVVFVAGSPRRERSSEAIGRTHAAVPVKLGEAQGLPSLAAVAKRSHASRRSAVRRARAARVVRAPMPVASALPTPAPVRNAAPPSPRTPAAPVVRAPPAPAPAPRAPAPRAPAPPAAPQGSFDDSGTGDFDSSEAP